MLCVFVVVCVVWASLSLSGVEERTGGEDKCHGNRPIHARIGIIGKTLIDGIGSLIVDHMHELNISWSTRDS